MMIAHYTSRCNIIKQTSTLDEVNSPTYATATVHSNALCRLDPVRFRSLEISQIGSASSVLRAMIYVEYFSDITTDMQIVLGGNTYNIVSINPIEGMIRGSHLEIEVNLVTNA